MPADHLTAAPGSTVSDRDWYGADLGGAAFESVRFTDVDVTEATGRGMRFVDCRFSAVTFAAAVLAEAAFENCSFSRCSFAGAELTDGKLIGSHFRHCRFDRLVVRRGDWSFVSLMGADLRATKLSGVRLREADLTETRCGGELRDCDVSGVTWNGADLTGCDLRGSDLGALDLRAVSVAAAIVDLRQAVALAANLGLDIRED